MTGIKVNTGVDVSSLATAVIDNFMTGSIQIINTLGDETNYDFTTNTGGNPVETIVWSGPARIHFKYATRGFNLPGNYTLDTSLLRQIFFQIPLHESDGGYSGKIQHGWVIRVTDGADDTILQEMSFRVESALNNTIFPTRTINCMMDAGRDPGWTS